MSTTDFMGRDGFIWFAGVVEDRQDPLKLGRVRVRCLGYHTEDKNALAYYRLTLGASATTYYIIRRKWHRPDASWPC